MVHICTQPFQWTRKHTPTCKSRASSMFVDKLNIDLRLILSVDWPSWWHNFRWRGESPSGIYLRVRGSLQDFLFSPEGCRLNKICFSMNFRSILRDIVASFRFQNWTHPTTKWMRRQLHFLRPRTPLQSKSPKQLHQSCWERALPCLTRRASVVASLALRIEPSWRSWSRITVNPSIQSVTSLSTPLCSTFHPLNNHTSLMSNSQNTYVGSGRIPDFVQKVMTSAGGLTEYDIITFSLMDLNRLDQIYMYGLYSSEFERPSTGYTTSSTSPYSSELKWKGTEEPFIPEGNSVMLELDSVQRRFVLKILMKIAHLKLLVNQQDACKYFIRWPWRDLIVETTYPYGSQWNSVKDVRM